MDTLEYLRANGVRLLRRDGSEACSLGWWDKTENLDHVLGKTVWICDFRNNAKDIFSKPIRAIAPKQVQVCDADNAKKTIYYSPIYFREVGKNGKLKSAEINAVDNTGFRSIAGTSLQIFEDRNACVACYKKLLEKAIQERKAAVEKVMADIRKLEEEAANL